MSFLGACLVFKAQLGDPQAVSVTLLEWISAGNFRADLGFLVDRLTSVFLLIITGVGFLIHVYSVGYMHEDKGFTRFFAYLNLFVFFMLTLVMGDNLLVTFIGWEGVGLCSYLLISFWYKDMKNNDAAKKAFVMNRIGDLGFLVAMFLLIAHMGTLNYSDLFSPEGLTKIGTLSPGVVSMIALCLFLGAAGKSAQIPLHTWLPDAMAAPTPISALIHAATMVTAGIFLIARTNVFFNGAPEIAHLVAWVGVATALLGAVIGTMQTDIKKVLAYSTVSQLGLMFLALGVGAYAAAVFHVLTHAFFKALLFLGSGSVIHAMGGEQDIRRMGGLKKHLPTTYKTFLIGTIAISGIPPLAGFFSKDEILGAVLHQQPVLFGLGIVVSLLTAFYMFRLLFLTFFGNFRGTHEQEHHLHESPATMTVPLVILAVLSIVGGWVGLPPFLAEMMGVHGGGIAHYLSPVVGEHELHIGLAEGMTLIGVTTLAYLGMIWYAHRQYVVKGVRPAENPEALGGFPRLVNGKFFVDEHYRAFITRPMDALAGFSDRIFEKKVLDGLVNSFGTSMVDFAGRFRRIQSGYLEHYVAYFVLGVIVFLAMLLF